MLRRSHQTAYPIERDCERMGLPLAVERGEGVVVAGRLRESDSEPLVACKEHDRAMYRRVSVGCCCVASERSERAL